MDNEAIRRCLMGLVRTGFVTDVDNTRHQARVKFPCEGFTSGWLYVLDNRAFIPGYAGEQRTEYAAGGGGYAEYASHSHALNIQQWMPKVNGRVLCLYLPTDDGNGDGFILGGF